jgi:hypothetical protein
LTVHFLYAQRQLFSYLLRTVYSKPGLHRSLPLFLYYILFYVKLSKNSLSIFKTIGSLAKSFSLFFSTNDKYTAFYLSPKLFRVSFLKVF